MNAVALTGGIAPHLAVFWVIWGTYGFWWGVWYGLNAHFWLAYRLALWLVAPQ